MKQSIGTSSEEREIMHVSYVLINGHRSKVLFFSSFFCTLDPLQWQFFFVFFLHIRPFAVAVVVVVFAH